MFTQYLKCYNGCPGEMCILPRLRKFVLSKQNAFLLKVRIFFFLFLDFDWHCPLAYWTFFSKGLTRFAREKPALPEKISQFFFQTFAQDIVFRKLQGSSYAHSIAHDN